MRKLAQSFFFARRIWLTVVLFITLFFAFGIYVYTEKQVDRANVLRQQTYRLADQLRQSSDDLTRMSRLYVATGKPLYKEYYQEILDIRDGRKAQPDGYFYPYWDMLLGNVQPLSQENSALPENGHGLALLDLIRQTGISDQEFGKLAEAKANSDGLAVLELEAMRLVSSVGPDAASAREKAALMLRNDNYLQTKAKIMKPIAELFRMMDKRTLDTIDRAENIALSFRILFISIALVSIFMLWRSFAALRTTLGGDVDKIYAHIAKIARGDFSSTIHVTDDKQNSILGWLSVMQEQIRQSDIERKSAMEELLESEMRMSSVLNNVIDGILTIDSLGKVQSVNLAGEDIFGYKAEEIIGKNVNMLMPEPYHSEHDGYLENYHKTGIQRIIGIGREVVGLRKDGTTFPMDLAVSRSSHNGQPLFIGLVRDITERKRVEQMKTEFVSTVSHELRTPLTAISGALGLICGGALGEVPDQAKVMLDIAYKNSKSLALLINDLLDMEKLAAGKMHLELKTQALMPLIEETLEAIYAYGEQYQVKFELIERADDVMVRVDSGRLQQVLTNFLSNAVKFSPSGAQVEIAVRQRKNAVQVEVIDHGSGIPDEFRSRIFQKFSQADSSDTRQKGGTGLGLAISKELIEQMNGLIGFESVEGQGACFHFKLPVWQAQEASSQPAEAPILGVSRLLVVEDDQDVAALMATMLNRAGYQVDVAANSETALNYLVLNDYAAITLDLMLPDQSGISLIRQIRSQAETVLLPIIVVSAYTKDGKLAINGDFNAIDWIDKPFDEARLIAAVQRFLPLQSAVKPRVLHVEDDADLHQIVAVIGRDVADFDLAHNLAEARAKLALERYSLVVLDIGLPDGSGWELLPDLKRLNPQPPVIVLSASEMTQQQQDSVQSALLKSSMPNQDLLDTLKRLLAVNTLDKGKTTL